MVPAATLRVLAYGGQSLGLLLLVEPHQIGVGHVDFAAHFEHGGRIFAAQPQRHVLERAITLCVMSSPTRPLPRVAAWTSRPFS